MIDDMAVYIANLGKYNEGSLVGAWFTFPIDEEDVKEKIGLNAQYEEYAIHDTDNFPIDIGEYVSIEELNEGCSRLQAPPAPYGNRYSADDRIRISRSESGYPSIWNGKSPSP